MHGLVHVYAIIQTYMHQGLYHYQHIDFMSSIYIDQHKETISNKTYMQTSHF